MTRHLDPEWSRPPKFWPFPIDIAPTVCDRCSSMVPATDTAQQNHRNHHRGIDQLTAMAATVALTRELSDPGSRATPSAPRADASPGSGVNVPTPEQEATAGRSGVEGTKSTAQAGAAGLPPSGAAAPPTVSPPTVGGTKATRPGAAVDTRRGESNVTTEANRSRPGGPGAVPTGRLHLAEPSDPRRFAQ